MRDLFWMPIEQYRRDGRIIRGLQRGAASFGTSTASAALELSNRLVQAIQVHALLHIHTHTHNCSFCCPVLVLSLKSLVFWLDTHLVSEAPKTDYSNLNAPTYSENNTYTTVLTVLLCLPLWTKGTLHRGCYEKYESNIFWCIYSAGHSRNSVWHFVTNTTLDTLHHRRTPHISSKTNPPASRPQGRRCQGLWHRERGIILPYFFSVLISCQLNKHQHIVCSFKTSSKFLLLLYYYAINLHYKREAETNA